MTDSHTHLNLTPLFEEWQSVWQRAHEAGVTRAIAIGTDLVSSKQAVEICKQRENLYAAVGIHPESMDTWNESLEILAKENKVVAIGECGLDYHLQEFDKNHQKRLFGKHIALAKTLNLPLSIHCRDAQNDLVDTLEHYSKDDGHLPKYILHCMSGDLNYLHKNLNLGAYISFAGNVTYRSAQNLRALLRATPFDHLLLETDAPFLSPASCRGTTNEPAKIKETYEFVAKELNISFEKLEQLTDDNFKKIFNVQ